MENWRRAGIFPGVKMVNLPPFFFRCFAPRLRPYRVFSRGKGNLIDLLLACLCFSNVPVYQ